MVGYQIVVVAWTWINVTVVHHIKLYGLALTMKSLPHPLHIFSKGLQSMYHNEGPCFSLTLPPLHNCSNPRRLVWVSVVDLERFGLQSTCTICYILLMYKGFAIGLGGLSHLYWNGSPESHWISWLQSQIVAIILIEDYCQENAHVKSR